MLSFSFRVSNALSHSGVHWNISTFFSRFSSGAVMFAYLLMNLRQYPVCPSVERNCLALVGGCIFTITATLAGSNNTPSRHTMWPNKFPCGRQKIHFLRFNDICNSLHLSNIKRNSATCSLSRVYIVQ
jgi:hypothetical protein